MHTDSNVIAEENSYLLLNKPQKKTKASFAGCPVSDRKLFANSSCILPISMSGSREHEGHRFSATAELINASFKSCTLLIVDSLYRHTLKIDSPDQDNTTLYNRSMQAGDDWLERNKTIYTKFSIPHKIARWDDYLQNSKFGIHLNAISDSYNSNEEYTTAINTSIEQYLARHTSKRLGNDYNYQVIFDYCRIYLQEECAVMCLLLEEKYNFEVYPNNRTEALTMTYNRFIKPFYPDLLRFVRIRFKEYNLV